LANLYAFTRTSVRFKNSFARGRLGKSGAPTFYFGTPYISETNRARKFKLGMLAGICRYYGYM